MQLSKVGELGNFIRDQRRTARLSLRKLSNMAGISNPYLSQIERGLRRPSAEILQAIAKALRISAETLYVKAGILEERGDSPDPVTSILRDLSLSEKQKQALIEVYQSFRSENEAGEEGAVTPFKAVALARTPRRAPGRPAAKKPAKKKTAKRKPAKKKAAKKKAAKKKTAKPSRARSSRPRTSSAKRGSGSTRRTARGRSRKATARRTRTR